MGDCILYRRSLFVNYRRTLAAGVVIRRLQVGRFEPPQCLSGPAGERRPIFLQTFRNGSCNFSAYQLKLFLSTYLQKTISRGAPRGSEEPRLSGLEI